MAGMLRAARTTLGSAVMTPSVSDQISTSSAPRAAPTRVAVRSEPLRPTVVISPASLRPTKPVTTGTTPAGTFSATRRRRLASHPGTGRAAPKVAAVTKPRSNTSNACAGRPRRVKKSAMARTLMRSPKLDT